MGGIRNESALGGECGLQPQQQPVEFVGQRTDLDGKILAHDRLQAARIAPLHLGRQALQRTQSPPHRPGDGHQHERQQQQQRNDHAFRGSARERPRTRTGCAI